MKSIEHQLTIRSDRFDLAGVLHLPDCPSPPLVIGSHGLEGSKASAKQQVLAKLLPKNGIAFFRFDHRGCGESSGAFITDTSLEKRATDLIASVSQVLQLGKTSRQVALFGSSMGGATCIHAWSSLAKMSLDLCGCVICSAPVKSRSITNIPLEAANGRPALPLSFFENNLLFDITEEAGYLYNVLIFHGDRDSIVPVENGQNIFEKAGSPKKLVLHKGGDHQMTDPLHQAEFEHLAPEWFLRCFSSMCN